MKNDITKQRDLFDAIFNSTQTRIFWKDLDSVYLGCNEAFIEDCGLDSTQEVIGKSDDDMIWKTDAEKYREDDRWVISHDEPKIKYLETFTNKQGHQTVWQTSKRPLKNSEGEIIGVIATSENITKEQENLRSLQDSEQKFRGVFENAKVGLAITDDQMKCIDVNSELLETLGYSREEFIDLSFRQLTHPDDLGKYEKLLTEIQKGNIDSFQLEKRLRGKDGRYVWMDASIMARRNPGGDVNMFIAMGSDISARKQNESKIGMLSKAIAHSLNAMDIISHEGKFIYCNQAYCDMWGYSGPDEILGTSPSTHCADPETPIQIITALKSEGKFEGEFTAKRKDGTTFEVMMSAHLDHDEEGNEIYVGTSLDVSERTNYLQKLQKSNERFDLAMEATQDGIFDWNLISNEIYYSPGWKSMLGYTEDELPNDFSIWEKLTDTSDVQRSWEELNKLIEGKIDRFDVELKMRHKDGHWVDIRSRANVYRNDDGKALRVVGTHTDITENKSLLSQNTMLSKAIESSTVGILITDISGTIEYVNPFITKITGYDVSELIGKHVNCLSSEEQPKDFYEKMWKTLMAGKSWTGQFHNRKKNGESYWENAVISPVKNEKGEIVHFVSVKEDISRLKRMVSELKQAKEKAEEANKLQSEFLHNMSHEIRTPLNGIMGFSQLLNSEETTSNQIQNYTKIIHNSSQQLMRVIDDILEISTLKTKKVIPLLEPFELNDLLTELFSIFNLRGSERNLALRLQKALPENRSRILSDRAKLHKILSNLLDNALKFTSEGHVEFGYYIEAKELILFVKDTGIGISEKNHKKIFDRFSQESQTNTRRFGGLGLGLSIAQENTQLLGGMIEVNSEKGKGATFLVRLPKTTIESEESSKNCHFENTKAQDPETLNILVVEDEEVNFIYTSAILHSMKVECLNIVHAYNGKEAVDICLRDKSIHMVLMDLKMPVMDGYAATEKIREQLPDLPIIAQTAYSTNSDREQALKCGCNDFISKPFSKQQMIELIEKHHSLNAD